MPVVIHMRAGAVNRIRRDMVVPRVRSITRETLNIAKMRSPVDTGQLRASLQSEVTDRGRSVVGTVRATAKHSLYVSLGTGIYGPRGKVITPKRGRFLVFQGRGVHGPGGARGGLVFARSVRGSPRNTYLTDALQAASPYPVRVYALPKPSSL